MSSRKLRVVQSEEEWRESLIYLCHKCLYYKHSEPVLKDHEFDMFEMSCITKYGRVYPFEMVGWDPKGCKNAGLINRLPLKKLLKFLKELYTPKKKL